MSKEILQDLMCELDHAEVNDRAQQLVSSIVRHDELEIEKKNVTKTFTDRIGELGSSIRRLSTVIRQRAESRPVACAVMFHTPCMGTKRIVRKDTGDIVRDEAMSAFEHQNNLFEDGVPAAEATEPVSPEQTQLLEIDVPEAEAIPEIPNGFDAQE